MELPHKRLYPERIDPDMKTPKWIVEGYRTNRLKPKADNPREVAFAKQWKEEQAYEDVLFRLVDPLTEGERRSVATIIQWLGSSVGFSFLRAALDRAGFAIVRKEGK